MRVSSRYSALCACVVVALVGGAGQAYANDSESILQNLNNVNVLASTIPANGDVNPYGVVEVRNTVGSLQQGHVLVSNFNNSMNQQGTGSTIVEVAPNGAVTTFAQINAASLPGPCPGGVGLTTALAVLRTGWVIVGSLPTSDGTSATAQAGCLLVLNSAGNVVETFYGSLINGPWDMTWMEDDHGAHLFVTNVLNGTVAANGGVVNQGTVVRIDLAVSEQQMPAIESMTVIGSGFAQRTDPVALVIGATGVGLSASCSEERFGGFGGFGRGFFGDNDCFLYVADTLNSRVVAIHDPLHRVNSDGTGFTLSAGGSLNGPLGLTVAPNGHILTVNGGDGYITEISPNGRQLAKTLLDNTGTPPGNGALFGVIFDPQRGVIFVDNNSNSLNTLN
jgi:hypothetical protein